jgi:hypothetical protein
LAQETDSQKTKNVLIVSGNITDRNGLPLIGAHIIVKGTTDETNTDFDGKFSLEIESGKMLSISYVGFKTTEVLIEPNAKINFVLEENNNQVSTQLSRKQMRKLRRANSNVPLDVSGVLIGILGVIAKD